MKKLKIYIWLNNVFVYRTETALNQSLSTDTVLESPLEDAACEVGICELPREQKFDDQRKTFLLEVCHERVFFFLPRFVTNGAKRK